MPSFPCLVEGDHLTIEDSASSTGSSQWLGMLPDVSPQITLLLVSPFRQLLPPELVL